MPLLQRVLGRIVDVRREEIVTMLLLFAYSFLAMTAYNIIQPLTRSKLISSLGAVNVPWVIFGSGLLIGVLMLGYTRLVSLLPRRWALPITQTGMAVAMIGFWVLFQTGGEWVSVAFYIWGLILGILLISQFWTLANGLYDPRQAKRLFGFVGGGVMLGGMTGAGLTAAIIETVGTNTLLLWSAFALLVCAGIVSVILGREREATASVTAAVDEEKGVSMARAFALLRGSRQIQLIAAVISFGSLGAMLIDQQLNMAAEMFKGAGQEDSDRRLPRAGALLRVARRVRDPGVGDAAHPSLSRHRVRSAHPADEPRHHRSGHHREQGPVGAGRGKHRRPLVPLLRRQDHPRGVVPAAALRAPTGREALRGRDGRPPVARSRRADDARADSALGTRARVVSAQLRQPGPGARVGVHVVARQARIPRLVPAQHRHRRGQGGRNAAERLRALDGGDARAGTGAAGPGARDLRDRCARVARQAEPGDAAPALPRSTQGAAPRAVGARRRAQRHRPAVDPAHPPHARRRRRRRPCRRHRRALVDQSGRRRLARPPAPRRSRSAHPRDGRRGHRGKHATRRTSTAQNQRCSI